MDGRRGERERSWKVVSGQWSVVSGLWSGVELRSVAGQVKDKSKGNIKVAGGGFEGQKGGWGCFLRKIAVKVLMGLELHVVGVVHFVCFSRVFARIVCRSWAGKARRDARLPMRAMSAWLRFSSRDCRVASRKALQQTSTAKLGAG